MSADEVKIVTGAPVTQTMERVLGPVDVLSVQQTPRGCLQECLGCDAKSEYFIYAGFREDGGEGAQPVGYMLEQSSCAVRTICSLCGSAQTRPFDMPITVPDKDGEEMVKFKKDWSFPTCCILRGQDGECTFPCCCFLPKLTTTTPDGTVVGTTQYICDMNLLVPKFKVLNADGNAQYVIRPDTCCGGCCVKCGGCGKGSKFFYVPYYIRDPTTLDKIPGGPGGKGESAQIKKVWSGMKKECCTTADNFFVIFPEATTTVTKANLLGATILVDFTQYEDNE